MNSVTISFMLHAVLNDRGSQCQRNNSLCLSGSFASVRSHYSSWNMCCEEVKPTDTSIALGDQERLP